MNLSQTNINAFLDKYINFVERVCIRRDYPNNVRHVLYLIVPAFIIKYGIREEGTILKCFDDIPILINYHQDKVVTAFFDRKIKAKNEDGIIKYFTEKRIVLNDYYDTSLVALIDNLAHEFNHAINSVLNEITWNNEEVIIRTGLSHTVFLKNELNKVQKRSQDVTLEEIINTKQTEDIINIINSFNQYEINNHEFNNALYTLKHDINANGYKSDAYFFQSYICQELMKNKTFIPTVENLRFKGNVDDIASWFDNITNIKGSYSKLNKLLDEILKDEEQLSHARLFKKYKLNKVLAKSREVLDLVKIFDNNCIYK